MSDALVEQILAAHGGLARWGEVSALRTRMRASGLALISGPGTAGLRRCEVMLSTREPWVVIAAAHGGHGGYRPGRTWIDIDTGDGPPRTLALPPAGAPARGALSAFSISGQAVWRYLCAPLLLLQPGAHCTELPVWREGGLRWRRLAVSLPRPHGRPEEHLLYVDRRGLIRRHDSPRPGGRRLALAHYCDRYRAFGGLLFPTRRRAYPRLPGGQVVRLPLLWLDVELVEPLLEASDA